MQFPVGEIYALQLQVYCLSMVGVRVDSHYKNQLWLRWKLKAHEHGISAVY